jgi:hypothetical protein
VFTPTPKAGRTCNNGDQLFISHGRARFTGAAPAAALFFPLICFPAGCPSVGAAISFIRHLRGPQKILREKDEVRIKATQEATMKRQQVFDVAAVRGIIAERKDMAGAMLPILHGIQDKVGYIPADAVPMIAGELNVSRAEVHGVISFYHFFRQEPAGRTWCRSAAPRPARRAAASPGRTCAERAGLRLP